MIFTSHGLVPGQLWSNVLPGDRDRVDYVLFVLESLAPDNTSPYTERFRIRCLLGWSGKCELVTITPPRLMTDWRALGYRRVL